MELEGQTQIRYCQDPKTIASERKFDGAKAERKFGCVKSGSNVMAPQSISNSMVPKPNLNLVAPKSNAQTTVPTFHSYMMVLKLESHSMVSQFDLNWALPKPNTNYDVETKLEFDGAVFMSDRYTQDNCCVADVHATMATRAAVRPSTAHGTIHGSMA